MVRMRTDFENTYSTMIVNSKVRRLISNFVYEDDLFYGKPEIPSHVHIADAPKWKESTNKRVTEKLHIFGGGKGKLSEKLGNMEIRNEFAKLLDCFD